MSEISAPAWVVIKKKMIEPFSIKAFLTQIGADIPTGNPVFAFARDSWRKVYQICKINPNNTRGSSTWNNRTFKIIKKKNHNYTAQDNYSRPASNLLSFMFLEVPSNSGHISQIAQWLKKTNVDCWLQTRCAASGIILRPLGHPTPNSIQEVCCNNVMLPLPFHLTENSLTTRGHLSGKHKHRSF